MRSSRRSTGSNTPRKLRASRAERCCTLCRSPNGLSLGAPNANALSTLARGRSRRSAFTVDDGLLTMSSLNNEIGKVDVTNTAESFLLDQNLVDRVGNVLLQLLLAVGSEHLVLGGVAQRHQHCRADRDLVRLEVVDHALIVGRRHRDPDL